MKLKILSLFTGIGAFERALKNMGIECEVVGFSEIDKYAIKSYCAIHNEDERKNLGDITKIDAKLLKQVSSAAGTEIDIITHGSPCQDFSVAGKQAGAEKGSGTRSSLMWYTRERVYTISIRKDIDNKQFEFPEKEELKIRLKDILEAEVDEKYYLSEKMQDYVLDFNNKQKGTAWEGRADEEKLNTNIAHAIGVRSAGGNQRAGVSNFVIDGYREEIKVKDLKQKIKNATNSEDPYIVASRGRNPDNPSSRKAGEHLEQRLEVNTNGTTNCISTVQKDNYVVEGNIKIRKLTPLECWRLMGFSDEDFRKAEKVNSNAQLYKQAGNSIVVNVLEKIFKNLLLEE